MCSGKLNMVVFLMVVGVAALQLQTSTAQTTHVVLDSSGWTIPPSGAAAYIAWASSKTFAVGDTLVFNFAASAHTVAEVTKAAFNACTTTGTLFQLDTPPVRVTLKSSGDHHYVCTIPGHCSAGQKLTISVTAAAPTPPPAPTTPPAGITAPPPPPPPNSAASFAAAALPVTFLSVVVALFY